MPFMPPIQAPAIPAGTIVMWSGSIASIPAGWFFCNGQNGTPDLRDRFVIAARQDEGGVAKTAIEVNMEYTSQQLKRSGGTAEHTHVLWTDIIGDSAPYGQVQAAGDDPLYMYGDPGMESNVSVCVPYFALAYIMKG